MQCASERDVLMSPKGALGSSSPRQPSASPNLPLHLLLGMAAANVAQSICRVLRWCYGAIIYGRGRAILLSLRY